MDTRPPGPERPPPRDVRSRDAGVIRLARGPLALSTVAPLRHVSGHLSLTLCPGRQGWSYDRSTYYAHNLVADVGALFEAGATLLVSLIEDHEFISLGASQLEGCVQQAGIGHVHVPIPDGGLPPEPVTFGQVVRLSAAEMKKGGHVVVHCRAGLGRSGLFAGCVLRQLGVDGEVVLRLLRAARGPRCPENEDQVNAILSFRS